MVVITFFVARYFGQVFEVNALQPSELEKATTLVNGVQGVLNRTDDIRLTLRRAGMRGRWQLIAIDPRSKEIISNIPQSLIPQRKKLFDLAKLEQPFSIRTNNMQLAGPFILKDSGRRISIICRAVTASFRETCVCNGQCIAGLYHIGYRCMYRNCLHHYQAHQTVAKIESGVYLQSRYAPGYFATRAQG